MPMNDEQRLTAYKKSLVSAWGYNDYNDWPIKFNSIMHLFLTDFTYEFLNDLEEIKKRGYTTSDIARAFGNPARLYRIVNPIIFGMKRMRIDLKRQREIVLFILDIVKNMKHGSEFNENGENTILGPQDLTALLSSRELLSPNQNDAGSLQRFCGILWAYTEAIFFRAHDVTKEIHGPYRSPGACENFVIREYLSLNEKGIWDDVPLIPYRNIKIYTEYTSNLKIQLDSYNHVFHVQGNYIKDLVSYRIEADGESIDINCAMGLLPVIQNAIESVHKWVGKSDWRAITNKYADIFWYRKKPLCDLLGNSWNVPESVRKNIETGEASEKRLRSLTREEIDRLIYTLI